MNNRSIRLLESNDETLTLDREQRRRILGQLRKTERLERENSELKKDLKDTIREIKKLTEKIRKLDSTPMMLASSDRTAAAVGHGRVQTPCSAFYRSTGHH